MTPADAPVAIRFARDEGWHDRTRFFELLFRIETCTALVGEVDGDVVVSGLAVVNGPVGWLGGLMVERTRRRRGYGLAMMRELMRRLEEAGCETLSLEATDEGRPMYEALGFRLLTTYHQLEAGQLDPAPPTPADRRLRPMKAADLPAVLALDSAATAEDRHVPLRILYEANGGWILERPDERLAGFLLPAERAYGAVVAPRFEDGLFLLELHRSLIPPDGAVRAGIPDDHAAAWRELLERGWRQTWQAPRMILGPAPAWHPEWIWGQINSAMG